MNLLRKHLSVANVLSCLALFVALSGAAYAATAARNSVTTKSIVRGAVTNAKLRNGAVTTRKLRNGAVTTGKLRKEAVVASKIALGNVGSAALADGGVRSVDLGGGVVTSSKLKDGAVTTAKLGGEAVDTGQIKNGAVTEAKLASSLLARVVKNVSYTSGVSGLGPSPNLKTATAECPSGPTPKQVVGGGARILGANTKVALIESAPKVDAAGNRTGWTASANELAEETEDWAIEAFAICAEL